MRAQSGREGGRSLPRATARAIAGHGTRPVSRGARDAEVEQLDRVVVGEEASGGHEVRAHVTGLVRMAQPGGELLDG